MDHLDKKILVPLHPLDNIEINKYFNYEFKFKDGANFISFDEK